MKITDKNNKITIEFCCWKLWENFGEYLFDTSSNPNHAWIFLGNSKYYPQSFPYCPYCGTKITKEKLLDVTKGMPKMVEQRVEKKPWWKF